MHNFLTELDEQLLPLPDQSGVTPTAWPEGLTRRKLLQLSPADTQTLLKAYRIEPSGSAGSQREGLAVFLGVGGED